MGGGNIALGMKTLAECLRGKDGKGIFLPVSRAEGTGIGGRDLLSYIERVYRVAACISFVFHPVVLASSNVILRNREVAEVIGRFYKGGHQTRGDMVLNVTMKEPDSGVFGLEPPYGRGILVQHDSVSSDWGGGQIGVIGPIPFPAGVGVSARQYLVLMAVEMHWVQILMFVLDHQLNYFAILEDERVGVDAIDCWISAVVANSEGGVERWNLLRYVGNVVDGETSNAIIGRIVHGHSYASAYGLK